jgi:Protein of unknown function (DUF3040)
MLDRDEHQTLRQIEQNLAAGDPEFAALLRGGQRRLSPSRRRKLLQRALIALLLLLSYALMVLGLPISALALVVVAAVMWALQRWRFTHLDVIFG